MATTPQKIVAPASAKDTSKSEKRIPHMKKALIAFAAILAVMCSGVIIKGALRKPPHAPNAEAAGGAAPPDSKKPGTPGQRPESPVQADVDGFHEKLAGYRQHQAGNTAANPAAPGVAGVSAGAGAEGGAPARVRGNVSEEERNFLTQRLRQPMQVHSVGEGQAAAMVQQPPAGPQGQAETDARLARLSAQLAEIKAKQGAQP